MAGTVVRLVCVRCGKEIVRGKVEPMKSGGFMKPTEFPSDHQAHVNAVLHKQETGHAIFTREECITLEND